MDSPTTPQNYVVPRSEDFANDVKSDRLAILWRITAIGAFLITFVAVGMMNFSDTNATVWIGAPAVLIIGCLVTRSFLKRELLVAAAWAYTLGCMGAVTVAMLDNEPIALQSLPFAYVVVVFIVGLLLHPINTFVIATVSAVLTILIPSTMHPDGMSFISGHQIFAIGLMFIGAGLASQVTGELYAVTEWALMNYQRERRTNSDLFESRNQLHRAFKRSEALSEKLKEINNELEDAHAAAEAAKNFRGQFLANMSHELRTPLNAIIGFSETMLQFPMMYDDEPLPKAYSGDMGQIYNSGRQLLLVINDILDLARVDAGKLEIYMDRIELKPVIDNAAAIARGLIGAKQVELQMELPESLPDVWADETRIRQVLVNLYSNACKFTDEGFIKLRVRETDEGILFSLQDTGIGIEPAQMDKIFEEFQQADAHGRDPRAGAGLGLAISRQLLRLMNGRIWAESTPGEGSTFYFILQPYHKEKVDTVLTSAVSKVPESR